MNLFSSLAPPENQEPLAARMRPKSLDDFFGQEHILGQGRLLRRSIEADRLSSVIFYGPPGTGKTTLARVIANTTKAHFIAINAVLAGIKDLREAIEVAKGKSDLYAQRTILFVDEVHRWNKAQQDALLPWVENGTILFIGATTENPYFEVIKPLVSRSRIFQLKPLMAEDLQNVIQRAIEDKKNGYGHLTVQITQEARDHLVKVCNGDARSLLNALELAVMTTPPGEEGTIRIDMAVAEESIQKKAVLYDKEGDVHYDTISAFIKSLRGSDPDAALYWMARMVYAGEEPRFIFRRMLVFASEDVGLADPKALQVVLSCAQAFEYVGMPEGRFHLSQAAIYLATAPKCNTTMAFFDALSAVEKEQEAEVPNHLRDASRDSEGFGHGEGYLYPHAYRDHWVAQQYLPDFLQGRVFYQPSRQGHEKEIEESVARRREEQLSAMLESDSHPEILTFSGSKLSQERDRWLERAVSQAGRMLGQVREKLFEKAKLQRHHLVLDLHAATGLFTWESMRKAPEGGVWALESDPARARALLQQFSRIPEIERPILLEGAIEELSEMIRQKGPEVRFDVILGRNALGKHPDKTKIARVLKTLLRPKGRVVLAETIPRRTQRLHRLLDFEGLPSDFIEKVGKGEESIYDDLQDPMVGWDAPDLENVFREAGFKKVKAEIMEQRGEVCVTASLLEQWFARDDRRERPSYAQHMSKMLSSPEMERLQQIFQRQLHGTVVSWTSSTLILETG